MSSDFCKRQIVLFTKQTFVVLAMLTLLLACNRPKEKVVTMEADSQAINDLPEVTLISESGESFSAKTLSGNTILIFFGATCDHCQREAQDFQRHLGNFSDYKLYFIAMDPFPAIHQFARDYRIDNIPNIILLRADGETVNRTLGYIQTPTIFVYNKGRRLIKRFDGETPVEKIVGVLPLTR